jgi:hypothetical protein
MCDSASDVPAIGSSKVSLRQQVRESVPCLFVGAMKASGKPALYKRNLLLFRPALDRLRNAREIYEELRKDVKLRSITAGMGRPWRIVFAGLIRLTDVIETIRH